MQIENLKLFCDLVETQNFTRAAEKNYVTTSAITQMLHVLEADTGEPLVLRGGHTFLLTRAGEIYYQYATEIVCFAADAVRQMQAVASGIVIELAACHSIYLHQLPPFLKQFRLDHAAVQINVRHGLIDRVHEQVLDNDVDLGLVCYPRRLPGLTVDPFRHERLVLVCHPQHPLATRTTVTVTDLKGCQFVAWNEIRWSPFLRNVPNCQRHLFAPHRECDQVEPVKRMVEMARGRRHPAGGAGAIGSGQPNAGGGAVCGRRLHRTAGRHLPGTEETHARHEKLYQRPETAGNHGELNFRFQAGPARNCHLPPVSWTTSVAIAMCGSTGAATFRWPG
jgi:LysR family transcriptional regulator, transcriptional activator of the cysJI operon